MKRRNFLLWNSLLPLCGSSFSMPQVEAAEQMHLDDDQLYSADIARYGLVSLRNEITQQGVFQRAWRVFRETNGYVKAVTIFEVAREILIVQFLKGSQDQKSGNWIGKTVIKTQWEPPEAILSMLRRLTPKALISKNEETPGLFEGPSHVLEVAVRGAKPKVYNRIDLPYYHLNVAKDVKEILNEFAILLNLCDEVFPK